MIGAPTFCRSDISFLPRPSHCAAVRLCAPSLTVYREILKKTKAKNKTTTISYVSFLSRRSGGGHGGRQPPTGLLISRGWSSQPACRQGLVGEGTRSQAHLRRWAGLSRAVASWTLIFFFFSFKFLGQFDESVENRFRSLFITILMVVVTVYF